MDEGPVGPQNQVGARQSISLSWEQPQQSRAALSKLSAGSSPARHHGNRSPRREAWGVGWGSGWREGWSHGDGSPGGCMSPSPWREGLSAPNGGREEAGGSGQGSWSDKRLGVTRDPHTSPALCCLSLGRGPDTRPPKPSPNHHPSSDPQTAFVYLYSILVSADLVEPTKRVCREAYPDPPHFIKIVQ